MKLKFFFLNRKLSSLILLYGDDSVSHSKLLMKFQAQYDVSIHTYTCTSKFEYHVTIDIHVMCRFYSALIFQGVCNNIKLNTGAKPKVGGGAGRSRFHVNWNSTHVYG